MEFKEQYKHPNWQKKRLEALSSSNYTCQSCLDGENQLHVHHKRYVKGRKIWEYGLNELEVLCNGCHEIVHEEKEELSYLLAKIDSDGLRELIGLISGYCGCCSGPLMLSKSDSMKYVGNDNEKYALLGAISGVLTISIGTPEVCAVLTAVCKAIDAKEECVTIRLRGE